MPLQGYGYRIQNDDGGTYDVPEDIARSSYPELFPQAGSEYVPQQQVWNPFQPGPMGQAEVPPWAQQGFDQVPGGAPQQAPQQEQQVAPTTHIPDQAMTPQEAQGIQLQPGQEVSFPVSRTGMGFQSVNPEIIPTPEQTMQNYMPGFLAEQQALQRQQRAVQAQGQVGYNPEFGPTYDQVGGEEQQLAADMQAQNQQAQEALATKEAEIARARQQISRMDPGRVFKNASTATSAMSVISAGIAGFLNPGGTNQVIETVMNLIDKDMEAQRADIETEKFNVAGMESAYSRMAGRQSTDRANLLFDRSMKIESLINGIEREKGRYTSEVVLGQLEATQAQLANEFVKTYESAKQTYLDNWNTKVRADNEIAAQKLDYRARMASIAESRAGRTKPPPGEENGIIEIPDPSNPSKSVVLKVNPVIWGNMPAEVKGNVYAKLMTTGPKVRAVDRYDRAIKAIKEVYDGPLSNTWNRLKTDPKHASKYNEYVAAFNDLLRVRAFEDAGKQLTPHELERFVRTQGDVDTWTLEGGADELAPKLRDQMVTDYAGTISSVGGYYDEELKLAQAGPTGPVMVPFATRERKFEPGVAKQLSEKSIGPGPKDAGTEEDATVYGWRTGVARISTAVKAVEGSKGESRNKAKEELKSNLSEFASQLDKGNIPLTQAHEDYLKSVESELEKLPPGDRVVDRKFIETLTGGALEENLPPGYRDYSYQIDMLSYIRDVRNRLAEEREWQRNADESLKRIGPMPRRDRAGTR